MNKYSTLLAGSALLATTALASGTVSAGSLAISTNTAGAAYSAFTSYKIGNTLLTGSNSSGVNTSNASFDIRTTLSYSTQTTRAVILISGAEFDPTATPVVSLATLDTSGAGLSLTNTSAVAATNVTVFTDRLIVGAITQTYSIMHVNNPTVKNMQALGTVGAVVTLSGRIENPNVSATYENIDSATYISSVASASILFSTTTSSNGLPSALNTAASVTASPPFVNLGSSGGTPILTAVVGGVSLTTNGGLSTNMTTTLSGSNLISTAELRITHGALADPAFNSLSIRTGVNTLNYKTATQIAAGVATFALTGTSLDNGGTSIIVEIGIVGNTPIVGGSGTNAATVTPTATATGVNAITAATGSLASIAKGGLASAVNTFQNSVNTVPSFLRLTNTSTTAGTYTVVIRNGDSASGAILGTYTGAAVQPQGTVQLSALTLESGAGLTAPTALGNYQLAISAAFNGYIQHLSFSSSTGVLSNLSAFRNGSGQLSP